MAVTLYAGNRATWLEADTKPTNLTDGWRGTELDTGRKFWYYQGEWQTQPDPQLVGDFRVRFFDIDGTVLKEEWVDQGEDATAPPTPVYDPTYLDFMEWNQPFTNVQSDLDVGAIYNGKDNKTYIFITLNAITGLTYEPGFSKATTDNMNVNWGDGNDDDNASSGSISFPHTYAEAGNYIVTVTCAGNYSIDGNTGRMVVKVYCAENVTKIGYVLDAEVISLSTGVLEFWDNYPFSEYLHDLRHLNIPNGVTTLIEGFVYLSYRFKTISIPNSVTSIGAYAFSECYSFESISIPNSVTSIVEDSFFRCYGLKSVWIGTGITSIGVRSFNTCLALTDIVILATTPPTIASTTFTGGTTPNRRKIYVPDANVDDYKTATNWSAIADYIYPLSERP